jgi:hypothetical protein
MVRRPVEFKKQWPVKFGLEVSTRDVGTSKVTSVLLFCEHCGRDDGDDGADGGTRKAEKNNKYKIIQESMAIRQFYKSSLEAAQDEMGDISRSPK